jgi:hypothetical protein
VSSTNTTLTSEIRQMLMERLIKIDREQESVDKRRAEATALLAALPAEPARTGRTNHANAAGERNASISSLIIQAVANKPGTTASEVVATVREARPEVNGRTIHAILYRLRAVDGKITHKGNRGQMVYSVATSAAKKKERRKKKRAAPPYKALALRFVTGNPGRHTVDDVASAINCSNRDQVRNILARLTNAEAIRRVSKGTYEANPKEAGMPSG